MKLTDAMILGSTTCEMKAGDWNTCALGAAANAIGIPQKTTALEVKRRIGAIEQAWPWLRCPDKFDRPWAANIFYMFDHMVCKGFMTYEQLVEYVRSIEPDCGECNMFECVCKKEEVKEEQCQESLV